jgi:hypothetical protein
MNEISELDLQLEAYLGLIDIPTYLRVDMEGINPTPIFLSFN